LASGGDGNSAPSYPVPKSSSIVRTRPISQGSYSRKNRFGFSAAEKRAPVEIQAVKKDPLIVVMPRDHAGRAKIDSPAGYFRRDIYRRIPDPGADPGAVINDLSARRHRRKPDHQAENIAMGIS
jgi:hypothetical protein